MTESRRLLFVKAGQAVRAGDVIKLSGNSGNATNPPPHLHFELRRKPRVARGLEGRLDPGALRTRLAEAAARLHIREHFDAMLPMGQDAVQVALGCLA